MKARNLVRSLIIFLVVSLLILPVFVTFSEAITRFVESFSLYRSIQSFVVPIQSFLVGLFIRPLNISYIPFSDGMIVNEIPIKITWNCVGWQSLFLFSLSLVIGLKGTSFTLFSIVKTIMVGFFGIFWINILRITFIVILATVSSSIFRVVFHDYLAAIITIIYLLFFWKFAYDYLLEISKNTDRQEQNI